MGQIVVQGTLTAGPVTVGAGFPQATFTTLLQTQVTPKAYSAGSGIMQRQIAVASPTWQALQGVGPSDAVQRGDTLYLKCNAALLVRLSTQDPLAPLGPPIVQEIPVSGLLFIEFPPGSPLVLLEAQGSATVEYAITGQ